VGLKKHIDGFLEFMSASASPFLAGVLFAMIGTVALEQTSLNTLARDARRKISGRKTEKRVI
jgi:hypothetical protein